MMLTLPKIIAHRGASLFAPENTLASLEHAKELGATWVECDVRLTKDNIPIIFHDKTLQRTTNGHGLVAKTTYHQIAELDAGKWFDIAYQAQKVPTLKQYLITAQALGLSVNLELKAIASREKQLADQVHQRLCQYWTNKTSQILISSFSVGCLREMRQCSHQYLLAYNMRQWHLYWRAIIERLDCVSIHCARNIINDQRVEKIKATGKKCLVYTVNDASFAQQLLAQGVDAIFSDDPSLLTQVTC